VGSAIGFLRAPFSFEATRGLFQRLINFDAATVNLTLAAMKQEAEAFVRLGARGAKVSSRLVAFMRYSGQGWEIPVEVKLRAYTDADSTMFLAEFETAYRQLFGRIIDGLEVEITNWSLTVAAAQKKASSIKLNLKGHEFKSAEKCDFFDAALRKKVSAALVERSSMQPDVRLDGPAMIIENETATIVTSGFTAIGQDDGSLLLLRKETAQ
jgi:N-methylhydantoinase A